MPPNSQEKMASRPSIVSFTALRPHPRNESAVAAGTRRPADTIPYSGPRKRARHNMAPRSFLKYENVLRITPISSLNGGGIDDDDKPLPIDDSTCSLQSWHLPQPILNYYKRKGIEKLFPWQAECLFRPGVLTHARNLLYSAPTSAGKSMVADMLLYKVLFERKKKAFIILPFVSICTEKVQSLKRVLRSAGIFMDSFAGKSNPRGGLARFDVVVCTIEKGNNMINKLIEENKLDEIGLVIVDELHMLGDSHRGYILELLLSKLLYISTKNDQAGQPNRLQIVGMSATIPNLPCLAKWLNAQLYITDIRPVPLYQRIAIVDDPLHPMMMERVDTKTKKLKLILPETDLKALSINPNDAIIYYAIETVVQGFSALVFCSTRKCAETMAAYIADTIRQFGKRQKNPCEKTEEIRTSLGGELKADKIKQLKLALEKTPFAFDRDLEKSLKCGVAYHHAGLSTEERSLIENGFREGAIRILCSTTTLSAGVNLPARRVLIPSPFDYKNDLLSVSTYQQMVGRAGRAGIDTLGQSFLFCERKDYARARDDLMFAKLPPIKSVLFPSKVSTSPKKSPSKASTSSSSSSSLNVSTNSNQDVPVTVTEFLKRAILELLANQSNTTRDDIHAFIGCTFYQSNNETRESQDDLNDAIDSILVYFREHGLIVDDPKSSNLNATKLGKAIVASGFEIVPGLFVFNEIDKATFQMNFRTDLHLIYLVTPTYLANNLQVDWEHYSSLWQKMDVNELEVANILKLKEVEIFSWAYQTQEPTKESPGYQKVLVYKRFYLALALHDIVQEMPLQNVASKYNLMKAAVQNLQELASTFAGMLSVFVEKLEWRSITALFKDFQSRLAFGVHHDLIDLMRIRFLTSKMARQLFTEGIDSLTCLIDCPQAKLESALLNAKAFEKNSTSIQSPSSAGKGSTNQNEAKLFVPTIDKFVSIRRLAQMIIEEANIQLEAEIGRRFVDIDTKFEFADEELDDDWLDEE